MIKTPVYSAIFNSANADGTPAVDYIIKDVDDNFVAKCIDADVADTIVKNLNKNDNKNQPNRH